MNARLCIEQNVHCEAQVSHCVQSQVILDLEIRMPGPDFRFRLVMDHLVTVMRGGRPLTLAGWRFSRCTVTSRAGTIMRERRQVVLNIPILMPCDINRAKRHRAYHHHHYRNHLPRPHWQLERHRTFIHKACRMVDSVLALDGLRVHPIHRQSMIGKLCGGLRTSF